MYVTFLHTASRLLIVRVGFFFFKQKTAYEMRISDWSSDVCSSDLDPAHHVERLASRHHLAQLGAGNLHPIRRKIRELPAGQVVVKHFGEDEIGRASCRERVCQYV